MVPSCSVLSARLGLVDLMVKTASLVETLAIVDAVDDQKEVAWMDNKLTEDYTDLARIRHMFIILSIHESP